MSVQEMIDNYKSSHTHPVNHVLHAIGIPTLIVSLPCFFFNWKLGLLLFVVGWIFQFVGHIFEGKPPAFFSNPAYLLIGPIWLFKKFQSLFVRKHDSNDPRTSQ